MRSASATRERRAWVRGSALLLAAGLAASALTACSSDDPAPAAVPSVAPSTVVSVPPSVAATPPPATTPAVEATSAALRSFYDQDLDWRGCGGYQCATLEVPRRYAAPDPDDVVKLPLLRNRADGDRIGSLVINPGGPGGSGVGYARRSDQVFPAALRARYDLVGFDPRGVQGSSPNIDCVSDKQLDRYIYEDASVDNASAQLASSKVFADGCAKNARTLYGEVGTRDAAKDLDILRAALGEPNLHFLGKSYGTLLGITYAETFPSRVGRMVLDGVLDPALTAETMLRGQALGFERAYKSFLRYCVSNGCPFGTNVTTAYAGTQRWLDEIDADPPATTSGRTLTRSVALLGMLGSLYEDRSQWAQLRTALRAAVDGSPYALLALADSAVDRQPGGRYPDNSNEAQYTVTCLDRPYTATVTQTAERAERFTKVAPVFGEYIAWGDLPCTQWRTGPTRQPHRITADLPPILLIGVSRDPATPLSWAESLRDQVATSRLITWNGDGHTGYFRGSGCVDSATTAYLLRGTVPADKTCTGR